MKTIEAYLESKGWIWKLRNGEYSLDQCPINSCGPGHFYINQAKEVFYCQKCGERGHLLSLKKRLGDLPPVSHISQFSKNSKPEKVIDLSLVEKYHKDLLENSWTLPYLTEERGFTLETIKKFRLGFKDGAITIPHFKDALCVNIKYRPIKPTGDKYHREEGYPSILFNIDNARKYQGSVIVTEGEFDTIAYDQMGLPNTVSVTCGAGTFKEEWIDDLERFDQVYLSYDMDGDGQAGAEKAADKLGRYRCLNVLLPLKDGNDCLKAGFTTPEMAEILAKAKPFGSKIIKGPDAYSDEIKELHSGRLAKQEILIGWKDLDDLLGGLRPNELTVLTGETGSGKTTFSVNFGYRLSKNAHPVLIASFEMKPVPIIKKMLQMKMGRPFKELSRRELDEGLKALSSLPIHFVDIYGEIGLRELKDAVYYARRRFGIEFVVLDHLHFFLRYSPDHERHVIDAAIKDIKAWAMELGIHIFLIVHPTKIETENRPIRLNDLRGSASLKQVPDNVLSLWRTRGQDELKTPQSEIILFVLKVRDDLGDEGKVILTFDKRSQSYEDSEPGLARPAEGRRSPASSPSFRSHQGRDWQGEHEL